MRSPNPLQSPNFLKLSIQRRGKDANTRQTLARVNEEKANVEKEFLNQIIGLSNCVNELRDELKRTQEALATAKEHKHQLIEELEDCRSAGIPKPLLEAIENIRVYVQEQAKVTPAAVGALAELDKQISIVMTSVPRNLTPRATISTGERIRTKHIKGLPKGCIFVSRSAYASLDQTEDRSTIIYGDGFIFAGVYDGHGGAQAAEFTSRNIFPNFQYAIENSQTITIPEAFEFAYKKTDLDYLDYARTFKNDKVSTLFSGTCAISCYIDTTTGRVTCGNLGDSRAVMGVIVGETKKQMITIPLSCDHRASCEYEQERIKKEHPGDEEAITDINGHEDDNYIPDWRVKKLCAFTRSIGDLHMKDKASSALFNSYVRPEQRIIPRPGSITDTTGEITLPYISNDPEIKEAIIKDGFLIIASGGVWDEMNNNEAVSLVSKLIKSKRNSKNKYNDKNIADVFIEQILKKVLKRVSEDDCEHKGLTLEQLKALPPGKQDGLGRSSLHDEMTVVILLFSSKDGKPEIYNATSSTTANNIHTDNTTVESVVDQRIPRRNSLGPMSIADYGMNQKKKYPRNMSMTLGSGGIDTGNVNHFKSERRGSVGPSSMLGDSINNILYKEYFEEEQDKNQNDIVRQESNSQILCIMRAFDGMKRDQLKILYDTLDANGNGVLDRNDIGNLVCQVLGTKNVTPLLLETAFYELDNDGSGFVDFKEFCDFFGIDE